MPYKNQDYGIPAVNLTMGSNASASGSGGITINNNNEIIYTPPVVDFAELNAYGSFTLNANFTVNSGVTTTINNLTASTSNPTVIGVGNVPQNITVGDAGSNYIGDKIVFATTGLYLITGQITCNPTDSGNLQFCKLRMLNNANTILFTTMNNANPDNDRFVNMGLSYLHKVKDTTADKIYFDLAISNTAGQDSFIQHQSSQINIIKISNDVGA